MTCSRRAERGEEGPGARPSPATPRHRQTLRRALLDWYAAHRRNLPWRRSPWVDDPYAVLVAEVMLQQTQVDRVAPKYVEFLARFPGWRSLAEAPPAAVIRAWAPLGYNQRAVRLQHVARRVTTELGGELPREPQGLRALDGLGPYTASAVACFAFGRDVAVVDTNVRRVLGRLFWDGAPPKPREVAALAGALVPPGLASQWNQALMDLGAMVCTAREPRCGACPARAWCASAPLLAQGLPRAAESRARYQARPFHGSRRYYRGRIVQRLRELRDGEGLPLGELGRAVKREFGQADLPWLWDLVTGLERDGLARMTPREGPSLAARVSLP